MFARLRPITVARTTTQAIPCRHSRGFWSPSSNPETKQQLDLTIADFTEEGPQDYKRLESGQDNIRNVFLKYKAGAQELGRPRPCPKLLFFESTPTITLGRRQEPPTGKAELSRLLRPVNVCLKNRANPIEQRYTVQCVKSTRGGLTTYHGPGQLVCWPILDMTSPGYPRYSVSSYATHLESTTQRLLYDLYGIETFTSAQDPGVWVRSTSGQPLKIAALGVHHRRHITSYGIAINIDIAVTGDEDRNVWSRFVPCGLEGKGVTSVKDQIGTETLGQVNMSEIAKIWSNIFSEGLVDPTKRVWNSSPREAGIGQSVNSMVADAPYIGATLAGTSALESKFNNQGSKGESNVADNAQKPSGTDGEGSWFDVDLDDFL